ncbi:MAG: hypothetical protein NCW75_05750 [Phycisphaera sp.]|nr:MAG: hypothetical protein NCW75_05750 [Phycisphaera sp.]
MSTIEQTQQGTLDFFNQRIAAWTASATELTLTAEDTAALAALLADAETKFDEAKEGWNEYRAKVDAQDEAIGALYEFGSLLVQQIRVAAKKDGTNQLYQLAQIDPPKPATPRTEAPIPTDLRTTNTTSGDIELSFKGSKAGGAVFEVQRQLREVGQQPGAWGYVATIGEKRYVDTAVPSGLAQISYRVRTQLTTGVLSQWSYPAPFYFGNGQQSEATGAQQATAESDGGETLTIEDAQALKDAQTAKGSAKAG